ncbi:DUF221-domain-containing protein, partial [Fragilariopsis cylindrus CCMP1102]
GYDALVFLRFHRLALRCIVKMSIFSFLVLLPLNYTGGGGANAVDIQGYVVSLFVTDFLRFTMANVAGGSPRLWVHCFAAYLLTAIVVRELLVEYETFNSIRHCYLLSREPHLRTVLVTNIPRHLRSPNKISAYFTHVYPNAVKHVVMCQNLVYLEALVAKRTTLLANIEQELLLLPIRSAAALDSEGHIEDHINEVTDKAFVVMRTFAAATIAIQSMHSSKPGAMQVSSAPEPRDVLWSNVYVSKGATRTRSILGEFLVILIISFYIIPVALVSLLVSEQALVSSSPRLAQLDQATALFSSVIALVQPLCIMLMQQILPPLFMAIGRLEGLVCFSDIQMRAFSRYFLFQVLNVFLVTTIAGSIFDTIATIVEKPEEALLMLGNSLPRMSSFFITFVTIKTFFGLGLELVRTMSLLQATIRVFVIPNATLRTARRVVCGLRAIDDPGWFPFHKILAQDMLVVVISVVFAVVAPLVLLPCALFCLFSRIMWTHHHLYVYESVFESGGQFWPKIFRRFVFGLIIAQMTITGQFILKEARHEAYATVALMFMTYLFLRSTRARYDPTSSTLPLEVATVMD